MTSATSWPAKVPLLGVDVSCVDYHRAVDCIARAAADRQPGIVACHAVHAIVTFSSDLQLREMVNSFDMITPDGQPVRWAMNMLHRTSLRERCYGPELMLRVCERAARDGLPVFLYGGSDEVSAGLPAALSERFPGLRIVGSESPPYRPLTPEEDREIVEKIRESEARIVFIGLGCPKQDLFAFEHRDRIQAVQICVGAAFDFHAGRQPMAPRWMQRRGLEWLYRLGREPTRLWKRYLTTNPAFVRGVASQWLAGRKTQA